MTVELHIDILPASYAGKIRTKKFTKVTSWDFICEDTFVLIVQDNIKKYIPIDRIEMIVEINPKVIKMVR